MTERITRLSQANIGGGGGRVTAKGHVGIWEAMEMFYIFIVTAVTWVYTFSKCIEPYIQNGYIYICINISQ